MSAPLPPDGPSTAGPHSPTGAATDGAGVPQRRRQAFAEQELRLISALVVLIGFGLFLALPFVLSIGSVVFLPVVTAMVLTVLLSPLADRLNGMGLPNALASLVAMLIFLAVLVLAVALILQPAVVLFDQFPTLMRKIGQRSAEIREQFAWLQQLNEQLVQLTKTGKSTREVVVATPSLLEELAFATPSFVLEMVLTLLMTFFMIEARVRLRQRLLFGRASFGTSIKAARVIREVQDRVASYILTVGAINVGVGIVVALGCWLLGVDAPIMWGGLAALLNFLPYVGPIVMIGLLSLFGIGTADTILVGLIPAAAYLGLHAVEANVVTPSILGARFTMNPVMILIALSYFTWVWGVFGALLSVPILLMLTALFDHVGRPNVVGFIFGEPLFQDPVVVGEAEENG